ncbi:MAG: SDR family NAD(P)-dependent oxidoreductase [Bacteriovorax sp.]|nr:SDR family NAD(P)-dependent oxidoreductase [Bacteriovorax sp.]
MNKKEKVWLITGCSTGFGRCLVEEVLKHGDKVIATARKVETIQDLVKNYPDQAIAVSLDVTKKDQIESAVLKAIEVFGRIDVLVNNAGYGLIGALEEVSSSDITRIFDTNVFGLIEMTKAVLPIMRTTGHGHILNISSVAGFTSTPGFGIYNATKYAVEGLSEALAGEVSSFGIKVTIIEPGPFKTDFANRSLVAAQPHPAYESAMRSTREYIQKVDGNQPGDPVRASKAMIELVNQRNPPLRIPFGKIALERINLKMKTFSDDLKIWEKTILETDFPL